MLKHKIQLLGLCKRFSESFVGLLKTQDSEIPIAKQDIIGLKTIHISHIFPITASAFFFIFLVDKKGFKQKESMQMEIRNSSGITKYSFTIDVKPKNISNLDEDDPEVNGVQLVGVQMPGDDLLFDNPGQYDFYIIEQDGEFRIGAVVLGYQPALPLSSEAITAIKSDPNAYKTVQIVIECKTCKDSLKGYAALERKEKEEGMVWYRDLQEEFICKCGKNKLNLTYIKESLHIFLTMKAVNFYVSAIENQYEKSVIDKISAEFRKLVEEGSLRSNGEEEIQKFIEENPILLGRFSAKLIKPKAPIGSKHKTDFAILNSKNELILIEIEKPSTKLFKSKGGQHSDVTAAFDQVQDWLSEAERNRLGLIDNLNMDGLTIEKITNIRGVVIAGRSNKENENQSMGKILKSHNNIELVTYDHLINDLVNFSRDLSKL